MSHHAKSYEETAFLTLTYSDENLPQNSSLRYEDVTLFIKKLRWHLSKTPYKNNIQYYRVGEYGEQFTRPHYHLILYGFDFTYGIQYERQTKTNLRELNATKDDRKYYKSNFLTDLWGHGHADIGDCDYATFKYCAKYTMKKIYGPQSFDHYLKLDEYGEYAPLEREKSSMSKGIGKKFIEEFWSDVYPCDHVLHDKKRFRVPKYYDTWLEKNDPELYLQVKQNREDTIPKQISLEQKITSHKITMLKHESFYRDGVAPRSELDEVLQTRGKAETTHFHKMEKEEKNVKT